MRRWMPARLTMSVHGTFEIWRAALRMSDDRGRPEVIGGARKRRFDPKRTLHRDRLVLFCLGRGHDLAPAGYLGCDKITKGLRRSTCGIRDHESDVDQALACCLVVERLAHCIVESGLYFRS